MLLADKVIVCKIITFNDIVFIVFCSLVSQWPLTSWPIQTLSFFGTERLVSSADLVLSHSPLLLVLSDTSFSSTLWNLTGLCALIAHFLSIALQRKAVFKELCFFCVGYTILFHFHILESLIQQNCRRRSELWKPSWKQWDRKENTKFQTKRHGGYGLSKPLSGMFGPDIESI